MRGSPVTIPWMSRRVAARGWPWWQVVQTARVLLGMRAVARALVRSGSGQDACVPASGAGYVTVMTDKVTGSGEYVWRAYERAIDWYKIAESKAQIILTVNGVLVTLLFEIAARPVSAQT